MSQQDKDPIVYRAIGTVRGIYKPSKSNPTTGILTTDDKEKFNVVLLREVADLFTEKNEDLTQQCLWKCYFRTKPVTLELKDVTTKKVDKNRYQSFKVNKFQVQGKVKQL